MKKTIKINEETHRRLKSLGKKGETFDDIIRRLLPPESLSSRGRREDRMRKLEDLAKIAKRKKEEELKSGKLERTDSGWRVNLGAD
ncbi:hypothetical protein AKJ37_06065 [candidate division MSBL1 archaeon SCGC-AAA259I09]|uniref:Antitoxin n=2 Tax=candidate division MSBL1 TaxID=215777 RepID=A0A133UPF2_9EURY|nr:hypothetical protein AKJ37_06065 [candidate division MSBL1 archaeon SCGC-AAA259I09]KXA97141.1 hypothetical protein AKJ39_03630 [candidate division MSBL1 archaeon SCGC-AAA259J03]